MRGSLMRHSAGLDAPNGKRPSRSRIYLQTGLRPLKVDFWSQYCLCATCMFGARANPGIEMCPNAPSRKTGRIAVNGNDDTRRGRNWRIVSAHPHRPTSAKIRALREPEPRLIVATSLSEFGILRRRGGAGLPGDKCDPRSWQYAKPAQPGRHTLRVCFCAPLNRAPVVRVAESGPSVSAVETSPLPRLHRRAELPGDAEAREVVERGGEIVPPQPVILRLVKSVCQSWVGAAVLSLNSSAALMTM